MLLQQARGDTGAALEVMWEACRPLLAMGGSGNGGGGGGGGGGNLVRCKMLLKLAGWLQVRTSPRYPNPRSHL